MVNEVNKIVYNLLLSGKEVYLGGIGTLFTVRFSAQRTSRKSLTPPYLIVAFTDEQRGTSLEEEIARTAEVDNAKAHEIYERWLSEVLDGDTLTIEEVGALRHGKFTINESFAKALNPQGRGAVVLKPKASVGLYIFASLCLLFALLVAGYIYVDSHDISLFGAEKELVAATPQSGTDNGVTTPTSETSIEVVTDSVKIEAPATMSESAAPMVANTESIPDNSDVILSTTSGTSYLVLGVFSTPENAAKAIRQAQKRVDDLHYSVYHYGSKFMVALYEAPTRSECQEFSKSLGDTFNDLWIYTRK